MKILYLNIFEGCKESQRLDRIINFINQETPDILGLSELYDWDKDDHKKLKYFLSKAYFKYQVFATSKYNRPVGLFSIYPIKQYKIVRKVFQTPLIKAKIRLVNNKFTTIILTHLRAKNEDLRLKEIDIIFKNISLKEPTVLMGDLNSLSLEDNYKERLLLKKAANIGLTKFGTIHLRRDVISRILKFGLIDTVKLFSKKFEYSVPTTYNKDKAHFAKLRLDYMFVTKKLLPKVKRSVIIRNQTTNQLSDHYPIVLELKNL